MHIVNISAFYDQINEALLTLMTGLAGWLATMIVSWVKSHIKFLDEQTDAQLAAGLNRALSNGVQIAMHQTQTLEAKYPGIPVQGQIAAWAAQYAADHSPAAMQKFGMSPNDLALKALAYLPTPAITDDTTGKTIPAPAQVQVSNLTPPTNG